ncbi:glycine zipper family protein [Inquilinus sp. Marseille-Q2685]|uniref:glycine zipper family protein n=1 Tax=Inquilinus sp. Marseille-Q2685 TaxID=2866581 RepID=UPI001CE3B93F|nr:glycine zipper family protein [Inquilinus sp. Marseille-Q2685]
MRAKRWVAVSAAVAIVVSGCGAKGIRPIIDPATSVAGGVNYETDVQQCQQLAEQVNPSGRLVAGLLLGAALGAASGALIGNAYNRPGAGAAYGAGLGATYGGVAGGASGAQTMQDVVRNCMFRRGYAVLEGPQGLMSNPVIPASAPAATVQPAVVPATAASQPIVPAAAATAAPVGDPGVICRIGNLTLARSTSACAAAGGVAVAPLAR